MNGDRIFDFLTSQAEHDMPENVQRQINSLQEIDI